MILSISLLLNNPKILAAVIDRTVVSMLEMDKVFFKSINSGDDRSTGGNSEFISGTWVLLKIKHSASILGGANQVKMRMVLCQAVSRMVTQHWPQPD